MTKGSKDPCATFTPPGSGKRLRCAEPKAGQGRKESPGRFGLRYRQPPDRRHLAPRHSSDGAASLARREPSSLSGFAPVRLPAGPITLLPVGREPEDHRVVIGLPRAQHRTGKVGMVGGIREPLSLEAKPAAPLILHAFLPRHGSIEEIAAINWTPGWSVSTSKSRPLAGSLTRAARRTPLPSRSTQQWS